MDRGEWELWISPAGVQLRSTAVAWCELNRVLRGEIKISEVAPFGVTQPVEQMQLGGIALEEALNRAEQDYKKAIAEYSQLARMAAGKWRIPRKEPPP